MKKFLSCFLTMAALAVFAAKPFEGPWSSEGTVFYLVHPGGPLKIDVTLKKAAPGYMGNPALKVTPSSLLAVMDPAEKVVLEKYWRVSPGETEKHYTLDFPDAKAGVWQLRSTFAFCSNMTIQFKTVPALKYGVLFSRSRVLDDDMQNIRNSYFFVPQPSVAFPNVKRKNQKLHLASRARDTAFFDAQGKKIATADVHEIFGARSDIPCNGNIELPFGTTEERTEVPVPRVRIRTEQREDVVSITEAGSIVLPLKTGEVYQFLVTSPAANGPGTGCGFLAVDGFPVIFCPDAETARKIGGSVVTSADGKRVFAYRFQKEMYDWMKSLKASDLAIEAVPISKYKKEWFADPRSAYLLNFFGYAEHMFKSQVTDPDDPAFGTSPLNLDQLTLLYALKRPYNPYYGSKALMNRICLYYFQKWLTLSEGGAFFDDPALGQYCGGLEWSGWEGMVFTTDYITLVMMKDLADKKLLNLWSEALALPLYRFWCHRLSCENQSLHWPLKLYALNMATGNPLFKTLAADYLKDLADPALSRSMKTGYFMEAYGPDGTYMGISASMLAFAARFAQDDAALPALKKFYELMAHTVVREPDGKLAAVNGFGHRTAGTWLNPQYGGGVCLMDDRLEDAAAVSQKAVYDERLTDAKFNGMAATKLPADLTKWCKDGSGHVLFGYGMTAWLPVWFKSILPVGDAMPNAKLPIERSENFERNFNDEFYARRTPEYYALFYTGNADWRWHYLRSFTTPFAQGTKMKDGGLYSAESSCPWMPMQGMEIFWTPKFGIFLSAHNWSMYSQNLVRFDRAGKVADFVTSYTVQPKLKRGKVALSYRTKFLNCAVERKAEMKKSKVKVELKVSSASPVEPVEVIEQIPYRIKPDLKFTYYAGDKASEKPGSGITEIKVSRANGAVVRLHFDRPVTVRQGLRSSATFNYPVFQIGLLEIVFDPGFDGTKKTELEYTMSGEEDK